MQAFEAPMLSGCNSNSAGRDIAQAQTCSPHVQYGATRVDGGVKLAFANPALVERPWENARFDV